MQRYGVTVPFDGVPLAGQRELLAELPDLGYTDVWSSEVDGADAFTPLVLASVWAPALRLGTAIAPIFTRGPATLAQSAAALAAAAPGRVVVGIGASSDVIVERWNGISFDRPLQRVRDTTRFLRAALAGEKVTARYEAFAVDGFRRGIGRRALAAYLNVPVYRAFHQWLGRGERLAPMWAAWEAGACRERVAQYVAAGVHTPILALRPAGGDLRETLRGLGPAAG
jgi:hypothetical protein